MALFRGISTVSLDAKGRLAVPTRYRDTIMERSEGRLIVTIDSEPCLLLYTLADWLDVEREVMRLSTTQRPDRDLKRMLLGHATECEMDGHGRILLPQHLRDHKRIDKRVVMLGLGMRFELWDEQLFTQAREEWTRAGQEEGLSARLESLVY